MKKVLGLLVGLCVSITGCEGEELVIPTLPEIGDYEPEIEDNDEIFDRVYNECMESGGKSHELCAELAFNSQRNDY